MVLLRFLSKGNVLSLFLFQEKQLKCDKCGKLFKRNSELVRHKATHSDARPHVCGKCGTAYKRRTHLSRHELSAHNVAPTANGRRVRRLKLDDTGALVPAADKSKQDTQPIAADEANAYFMMTVPDGVEIHMPNEEMVQIYGVDGLSCGGGGDELQEFNIVDQLVSSLMPGKDVQVGECSYNGFGAGVPLSGDGGGINVDRNADIPLSSNEYLKTYQYMVLNKR